MSTQFLLYGANGFVGSAIARLAVQQGLRPVLAGRNAEEIKVLAADVGAEYRIFRLEDSHALDNALKDVSVVLHCAGPFLHTSGPMADACLRTRTHYLDLTGEMPVFEALAARSAEAKERGVMLLPGVGFDVVPTDCLALHLKKRLPSAARLTLAFCSRGPAGLPPGTQRTAIEMASYGNRERRSGELTEPMGTKTRMIDFGFGPLPATQLPWGDVFTAYYSTGIPDIEDYAAFPKEARRAMAIMTLLRPLFKLKVMREFLKRGVKPGPTADECARTSTHVWGEVLDSEGRKAVSRLHGPEAGVVWTSRTALAVVRKVLEGNAPPGFQTPALAYGTDLVLEAGVTREDVI